MPRILLIDDEETILDNLKFILELEGYQVITASNGREGLRIISENRDIDTVISDMKMPGLSGLDVIRSVREVDPDIGVIILTGHGDMDNAIQSMREGAFDYLNKPVNADKLILCLERVVRKTALIRENRRLHQDIVRKNLFFQSINESARQILMNMIPRELPRLDGLRLSCIYQCCENVGGDMYDVFEIGDKSVFYVSDVCGHGLLSAVTTMILKSAVSNFRYLYHKAGMIPDIEEVVEHANGEMYANTASNLFATLFIGIYDRKTHVMDYISAGHVDQYLVTGNEVKTLPSTSTVIGIFEGIRYTSSRITINPGDRLYLFTDGIIEIWKDDVIVATDEIIRIISENKEMSLEKNIHMIHDNLIRLYKDKSPDDDITLLGIEFTMDGEGKP